MARHRQRKLAGATPDGHELPNAQYDQPYHDVLPAIWSRYDGSPENLRWTEIGGLSKLDMGYSPEQIVRKLRQAEGKLASGSTVAEVAREFGISEASVHRWKNR